MKKTPTPARPARTAAALCLSATALAATASPTLTQTGFANAGAAATISVAGGPNNGTFHAGEFTGVFNGESFLSYCVDLSQYFSFGNSYADYAPTTGLAAFGATRATQLGELLTAVGGFATSTPSRSAAVQAAVWEILYETGPLLSLGSGSFTAGGGTTAASDIAALNNVLGHLGDYAAASYSILASPTSQDFITAARDGRVGTAAVGAIPEPSSLALIVAAIGGAAFSRRRRA